VKKDQEKGKKCKGKKKSDQVSLAEVNVIV